MFYTSIYLAMFYTSIYLTNIYWYVLKTFHTLILNLVLATINFF